MKKSEIKETQCETENEVKLVPWVTNSRHGLQIIPQQLTIYLREKLPLKITDRGHYYLYDGKKYNLLTERDFKAAIKEYLPPEIRTERDWSSVFKEFETNTPDIAEADLDSDENIVAFENGVLHLDTMELHKFSDKYLITRLVPCKYLSDVTLDDAPVFSGYISRLVDGNPYEILFLMEYIGAVLSSVRGYRFKKLLMLVGAGNTGKSQLREFVIKLIGEKNNSSIDLMKLQKTFGTSQLYGKRLAGSGDMSNMEISELNTIKELTGGDDINAEFKGKDAFNFKYLGFLWFNANDLPFFRGDRGNHVYERFCIVRCKNIIPAEERDPQLLEKLWQEKDAVASLAIYYLKMAIDRGYTFSESDSMTREREQYRINNNSFLAFMDDCIVNIGRGATKRAEFNRLYKVWCASNSLKPERDREIPKVLNEQFHVTAKKSRGEYWYPFDFSEDAYDLLDSINKDFRNYEAKEKEKIARELKIIP